MHSLRDLSFFLTNKTGALHREIIGLMKILSHKSLSWSFNLFILAKDILYGGIEMVFVSGNKSMAMSISRSEGTP